MNAAVREWTLGNLLDGFAHVPAAARQQRVTGLALDSRRVQAGDVFFACAGTRTHGLTHVDAAIERGAVVVLWEQDSAHRQPIQHPAVVFIGVDRLSQKLGRIADRFYGSPSSKMGVMGVTGTDGKTSVSQFLAQALDQDGARCGVIGTLGYGFHDQLKSGSHTTPDAITVHREIAELKAGGARWLSMEVSSHALDQGRVSGVAFDYAVFTNLSREHLDYHGTMEAYGAAKRRLFEWTGLDYAIINLDDAFGRELSATLPTDVKQIGYSLAPLADATVDAVHARNIQYRPDGFVAEVVTPWGNGELQAGLLGHFNVQNLLAVLATLLAIGVELPDALLRLSRTRPVAGRMQTVGGGDQPLVVVDYAHTPGALEHVLKALREHARGELYCVFGCGGDRDAGKRPLMGGIAEQLADHVVLTDDNPRSEVPAQIAQDILAGIQNPAHVTLEHDRARAIAKALAAARPGDVVLIAGKGHETVQLVGLEQLPFDDVEVARRLLAGGGA